jgi:hypothetical protein
MARGPLWLLRGEPSGAVVAHHRKAMSPSNQTQSIAHRVFFIPSHHSEPRPPGPPCAWERLPESAITTDTKQLWTS